MRYTIYDNKGINLFDSEELDNVSEPRRERRITLEKPQ